MSTKIRRSQLEKMPKGMALQWIKKMNKLQCDDPEWVTAVKEGKIILKNNEATITAREQLVKSLREKNRAMKALKKQK
jgi:transcription elongation factor GreA-like protein